MFYCVIHQTVTYRSNNTDQINDASKKENVTHHFAS
jgi:hypothetical protein